MKRENALLLDQLADARNFLRSRLEQKTLGEVLDGATPAPTELAGVALILDLVGRGHLLREHTPRQAFTILCLQGPGLLSRQPA